MPHNKSIGPSDEVCQPKSHMKSSNWCKQTHTYSTQNVWWNLKLNQEGWAEITNSFSRSSGVSLGVPMALTRRWKVETAVLIWNIPEATAWDGSFFPFTKPLGAPVPRPDSRSRKLIDIRWISSSKPENCKFPQSKHKAKQSLERNWDSSCDGKLDN